MPIFSGIVIPAAGEDDVELGLSRRETKKKTRRNHGMIVKEMENAFTETRVTGCSARGAISTSFLERIGFPLEEFGGDICLSSLSTTLSCFKAGLTEDAKMLLGLTKKRLEEVAMERGALLTTRSLLKVDLVREIFEVVSDQEIFDRDVAESASLRRDLESLL